MIRLKELIAPGMMRAHKLSSKWSSRTTRYKGIIPPLNSIGKITRFNNRFRPTKALRARGYAMVTVKIRLKIVPTTVTITDTPMLRAIISVENMYLYAATVKVSGIRNTARFVSSASLAKDPAMI
jgi:hypothetical protein